MIQTQIQLKPSITLKYIYRQNIYKSKSLTYFINKITNFPQIRTAFQCSRKYFHSLFGILCDRKVSFVSFRLQQVNFGGVHVLHNRNAAVIGIKRRITDSGYDDEEDEEDGEAGSEFFSDGKISEKMFQRHYNLRQRVFYRKGTQHGKGTQQVNCSLFIFQ